MASSVHSRSRQDGGVTAEEVADRLHETRKIAFFSGQRQVDHASLRGKKAALDHLELEQAPDRRRQGDDLARMRDRPTAPMSVEYPADAGRLEGHTCSRSQRIELLAQPIPTRVERLTRLRRIHIARADEAGAHCHNIVVERAALGQCATVAHIHVTHQLARTAERAERETSAPEFTQRREVRLDSPQSLNSSGPEPGSHDLIEDHYNSHPLRLF